MVRFLPVAYSLVCRCLLVLGFTFFVLRFWFLIPLVSGWGWFGLGIGVGNVLWSVSRVSVSASLDSFYHAAEL